MTTESTIFKVKDGYILLEDLESWYSTGLITSEDRIQIFENNNRIGGKRMGDYRVDNLIKIYGDQFPFRRIPRPYEHDPLTAYTSDEDDGESVRSVSRADSPISSGQPSGASDAAQTAPPPKTMGGAFGAPKPLAPLEMNSLPVPGGMSSGATSQDSFVTAPTSVGGAFGARERAPSPAEEGSKIQQEPFQDLADVHDDMPNDPPPPPPANAANSKLEYRDYPLYSLHNEPEEDRITGVEVFKEMDKLKALLPLNKRWATREKVYFYFLNRRNYPEYSSMAICRLCNHTPYGGRLFFQHLFDYGHTKKLSEHHVSRKSFLFWQNHIEKCRGSITVPFAPVTPVVTVPAQQQTDFSAINKIFKSIPLFSSGTGTEKSNLEPEEISNLMELFSKIDENSWAGGDDFLSAYYDQVSCSMYCDLCEEEMPHQTYNFTKHVLSEKHLKALKGINQREVNFWLNILNLEISVKNMKTEDMMRIMMMRNKHPIPLLDFKLEVAPLQKSFRMPKIEELRVIYKNIKKEQFSGSNATLHHQNASCFACNLPGNSFSSQTELLDHIFSDEHVRYLLQFGFSERAYLRWKNIFEDVSNRPPVTLRGHSEQPISSPSISQVPQRGKSEEPTSGSKTSSNTGNNPRVPLLDLPAPGVKRCSQKEFVQSMRDMVTSLNDYGKTQAKNKVVDWTCEYCADIKRGSVSFSNELDAFTHITSQKHMEKLKFTAPSQELSRWVNWALRISGQAPRAEVGKSTNRDIPLIERKMAEVHVPELSKFPANVPRVPMLDRIPPNTPNVYSNKNKIYGYLGSYHRHFQKCGDDKIRKALAMRVNWICTYCEEAETPVPFGNMLYAFRHIMTVKHWDNMKHTASVEDLCYWKEWAKEILSDGVVQVITTLPEPRSEKESGNEEQKLAPKVAVPVEKFSNVPRIPLLDEMPENEYAVTKELFNQLLDECSKIYRNNVRKTRTGKYWSKTLYGCTFCSTPETKVVMRNELDAFLHITKTKHREKMAFQASESDLQYWKDWVIRLAETVKNDNMEEAKPPSFDRLPLLQPPDVAQAFIMTKAEYQFRYRSMPYWKLDNHLINRETIDKKVNSKCHYCPDSPPITSLFGAVRHIFTTPHDKNSNYEGTAADFVYYQNIIGKLSEKPKEPPSSYSTPIDPKPSAPTYGQTSTVYDPASEQSFCTFPLFRANPTERVVRSSDTPCTGPTNAQLMIVRSCYREHDYITRRTPQKCKPCNIDMSNWSDKTICNHAFTVSHLDKLHKSGVRVFKEDFNWWISNITRTIPGGIQPSVNPFYMGIYRPDKISHSIFYAFDSEQKKVIGNVDESKLEIYTEALLLKFGGCPFCNEWCMSPLEIVKHYTSDAHFARVRQQRLVTRMDVDYLWMIVITCQKERLGCSIM